MNIGHDLDTIVVLPLQLEQLMYIVLDLGLDIINGVKVQIPCE
jgi:hypothetical protein